MQLALDFLDIADVSENAELVKLASSIPQVLQSSISMNTYKSYSAGFKKWATWCSKFDFKIFPVEQKLLLLFISELIHRKVSTAVLNSVIFSISWIHSISNVSDPCKSQVVQRMLEGAKRLLSKPRKQKEPLSIQMIDTIIKLYGQDSKDLPNLRFVAMSVLGFFGFLRFSELVNLRRSDIKLSESHIELFIEKSKTDKYREGAKVVISEQCHKELKTCLNRFFVQAKIKENSNEFIFRAIIKKGSSFKLDSNRKLSYTRAREILLEKLEQLGIDKTRFGLHSLRSGGASEAGNAGVPDRLIMKHGRWTSEKSKNLYIHESMQNRLSVTENIKL